MVPDCWHTLIGLKNREERIGLNPDYRQASILVAFEHALLMALDQSLSSLAEFGCAALMASTLLPNPSKLTSKSENEANEFGSTALT